MHNIPHRERVSTRPLRENRCDIDYSVLNDGYDEETNSPKRRRRHSSRPGSEPTAPRQAAQKKIVETKIHLSSQYDNLDLEKIMDSQYPALQLVPLSGVTNSTIDKKEPSEKEYVTPVLGTITVHGITENKPDLDNDNTDIDLEEMATTENKTETIETRSEPDSTLLQIQPDDISLPKYSDNAVTETGNSITKNLVQVFVQTLQQPNTTAQNCGHSFMRKSDLSIHVQMHDKDTWQWAECDWKTSCKKYLQAHLIGHKEDLCYKCDQCNKRCKFREQLRRHKKKEHKTTN